MRRSVYIIVHEAPPNQLVGGWLPLCVYVAPRPETSILTREVSRVGPFSCTSSLTPPASPSLALSSASMASEILRAPAAAIFAAADRSVSLRSLLRLRCATDRTYVSAVSEVAAGARPPPPPGC